MAASIAFPCEPVTNGAVAIQSTTFAFVGGDYKEVGQAVALASLKKAKNAAKYFPKQPDPNWIFGRRKDVTGVRNTQVIGINVLEQPYNAIFFSLTANGQVSMPVVKYEVSVHSWYPSITTLSDLSTFNDGGHDAVTKTVWANPETGSILTGNGLYTHLFECVSVLFGITAAGYPTTTPLDSASGLISPFTG